MARFRRPLVVANDCDRAEIESARRQFDVAVLTAPRDEFQGAHRHEQDRLRPKPERGIRRPFTLTHVLIFAFVVSLFLKNESAIVAVAVVYGLFSPWGFRSRAETGHLVWTRRAVTIRSSGRLPRSLSR